MQARRRPLSSAGERPVYTRQVGGSNPSGATNSSNPSGAKLPKVPSAKLMKRQRRVPILPTVRPWRNGRRTGLRGRRAMLVEVQVLSGGRAKGSNGAFRRWNGSGGAPSADRRRDHGDPAMPPRPPGFVKRHHYDRGPPVVAAFNDRSAGLPRHRRARPLPAPPVAAVAQR